jgi:hypothetical protein
MRALLNIFAAIAAFSLFSFGHAGNDPSQTTPPLQIAQAGGSCIEKCEKRKEECFAQYTATDVRGNKYVTPDGHKICWDMYHECAKYCPKK